ncbi:MAG: rhodanese-like domain-containing protein, partial [Pseudaminobacter sp.]
ARSPGRFAGIDPEPRPGLRSGHMPGARNVPSSALSENGELLPVEELRAVLENAGLDLSKPVVTSCGSGVTAAAITLALESVGHTDNRLYDGSWTEWGGQADTPVVTGKA